MDIAILIFDRLTALDAIGPYEVLQRLPGATVRFVAAERGPVRTEQGMLGLVADFARDEVTERRHPGRARRDRHPPARRRRADPRVDPRDRRGKRVDHVGVHRFTAARRGRAARGQGGDDALARPRAADEVRRDARVAPRRGAGQDHHRRGRVVGHRHGVDARGARRRRRDRPGDPARHRVRPAAPLRQRIRRQGPRVRVQARARRPRERRRQALASANRRDEPGVDADRGSWQPRATLTPVRRVVCFSWRR